MAAAVSASAHIRKRPSTARNHQEWRTNSGRRSGSAGRSSPRPSDRNHLSYTAMAATVAKVTASRLKKTQSAGTPATSSQRRAGRRRVRAPAPVHRRPGHREQLSQPGDVVLPRPVQLHQVGLLARRQLGLLALQRAVTGLPGPRVRGGGFRPGPVRYAALLCCFGHADWMLSVPCVACC
jgi:hypothetical protein